MSETPNLVVIDFQDEDSWGTGQWFAITIPFFDMDNISREDVATIIGVVFGPEGRIIKSIVDPEQNRREYRVSHGDYVSRVLLRGVVDEHDNLNKEIALVLIKDEFGVRSEESDKFLRTLTCGDWLLQEVH